MDLLPEQLIGELTTMVHPYIFTEKNILILYNTAENLLKEQRLADITDNTWHKWLDVTSRPQFLTQISELEQKKWYEISSKVIQHSSYSLLKLWEQRIIEQPEHTLFRDMGGAQVYRYSYTQVNQMVREFAGVFHSLEEEPRVAIFSVNSPESAATDLACLFYDIYDTPLNIHFNAETLLQVFDSVGINTVVTDNRDRLAKLLKLREQTKTQFRIYVFDCSLVQNHQNVYCLPKEGKKFNYKELDELLTKRERKPINEVTTTMFTSGSTGMAKGVSFSNYNLVNKRFARHAAVPFIGQKEVLLCFLPLFHTFGRYLEMLGVIYWRGTYVFAGNPSAETLQKLFPAVNPSVFISVPIRWKELYEKVMLETNDMEDETQRKEIFRKTVGTRLKWGLSAAGYLSPKAFRFFQDMGVELCSGFGMTEATGGITMTLPGNYRDDSTGLALPGVKTRLKESGELEISGHYIAKYLDDAKPGDTIPFPENDQNDYWFSTGDIFTIDSEGHHEIIDRVKDIYKNSKGQTVAPRVAEQKFVGVPGILNTFLVGDAKPYNVLLIVPDNKHTILQQCGTENNKREYFHQIVMSANKDVPPYERVVNFAITKRNFTVEKGELTAKGSLNRKTIERNFAQTIDVLYQSNRVTLQASGFTIVVPRWFYRDLGILETDIVYSEHQLLNVRTKQQLAFKKLDQNKYLVGDLVYKSETDRIDIGRFTRQPRLWLGNPSVIDFCPVKDGWDLPLKKISPQTCYPRKHKNKKQTTDFQLIESIHDSQLVFVNNLIVQSMFADDKVALSATKQLGGLLEDSEKRLAEVIQRRLESLSCHPNEELRKLAYRILLISDPLPNYSQVIPAFIQSGLSFLDEDSIKKIAFRNLGKRHLQSLRQRLSSYRNQLNWPASETTRGQFANILKLLYNFGVQHLEYYDAIRSELASWILHYSDPELSKIASELFQQLAQIFEAEIYQKRHHDEADFWSKRIVYEFGTPDDHKARLDDIIINTAFVEESIYIIYNDTQFTADDIKKDGLWVTKLLFDNEFRHYRITINTKQNKHYDIHAVVSRKPNFKPKPEELYWISVLSEYPFESSTLPPLGYSMPLAGVRSSQFIGGLTVWEKIRQFSEIHQLAGSVKDDAWKKLFVKAFTAFFRAWKHSAERIIPGSMSPNNVVVPELDFRESAKILTLSGFREYKNVLNLMEPLVRNFYNKTIALYPWISEQLKPEWLFDGMLEALGQTQTTQLIDELYIEIKNCRYETLEVFDFEALISNFKSRIEKSYYYPLKLKDAVAQYSDWRKINPLATADAKEQTIAELLELFRLHKYNHVVRYNFYRNTYFSDASEATRKTFDLLLKKIESDSEILTVQLIELSDLQSELSTDSDKRIFSKMVFPKLPKLRQVDFLKVGKKQKEQLVVRNHITDKSGAEYLMREPIEPGEIGQLYQLFFEESYPKTISKMDQHFVVTDRFERVIGGICYKMLDNHIALLDGSAITTPLQGKGIGSAMIEDFFSRMSNKGVKTIKAHFLFGNYYLKHNFRVDKKWGALVKHLDMEQEEEVE